MPVFRTRPISWIEPARKDFLRFPPAVQEVVATALTVAAAGGLPDRAKPLKGFGPGVFEIALPYRGDAWRVVFAARIGDELWVIHAFQKKSRRGAETPRYELDVIASRLKRLRQLFT